MNEAVKETNTDLSTPEGIEHAVESFFEGYFPDDVFLESPQSQQQAFCHAIINDRRLYNKTVFNDLENLPESVPRDGITKAFLAVSSIIIWDPSFFGEIGALLILGGLLVRGYINKKNNIIPDEATNIKLEI